MHLKDIISSPRVSTCLGRLTGHYIRFVYNTARITYEPAEAYDRIMTDQPAIFAFWHGMAMMAPAAKPVTIPTEAMISRDKAAGIIAIGAESQELGTIRASGAGDPTSVLKKGGASGFRQALKALKEGRSILMTADIPKVAQVAGRGVVLLARHSGRPIVPIAYVSRWAIRFNNWDRMAIDLPFSRAAVVHGSPIHVDPGADDAAVDAIRHVLALELDRTMARAHELVGRSSHFRPGPRDHG